MKILIIDDSSSARIYTKNCVESCFSTNNLPEIIIATEGPEALKLLEGHHDINLIISDVLMPLVGGKKLLKRLSEKEQTRNIPVLLITAQSDDGEKNRELKDAGAFEVLGKPIDKKKLIKALMDLKLLEAGW